jgi:hypothetical protein
VWDFDPQASLGAHARKFYTRSVVLAWLVTQEGRQWVQNLFYKWADRECLLSQCMSGDGACPNIFICIESEHDLVADC